MCKMLKGTGATVNIDDYYMSTVLVVNLLKNKIFCMGTIRSSRKFVPKSALFTTS